ncbi:MAG: hypothetical protein OEM38_00405 [Gammaproteobacteria bacterium]|nr:hypothetical protein [Gammaproteobacteria bacterium]
MSITDKVKSEGLKGVSDVAKEIAEPNQRMDSVVRTLNNWFKNKPKLFDACIMYAKSKKGIK